MESDKTPSGDGMRSELLSASGWKDYELLDSGRFEKLERFGRYVLARPEPQAVWDRSLSEDEWRARADAVFRRDGRSGERGEWTLRAGMPDRWFVEYGGGMSLKFRMGLTSFKHVGLFPEQAENWEFIFREVRRLGAGARVLNLFAYTGGASLAARAAGADVTHVDSVKPVVSWARENMEASGMDGIRWIVEDALKFEAGPPLRRHRARSAGLRPGSGRREMGSRGAYQRDAEPLRRAARRAGQLPRAEPLLDGTLRTAGPDGGPAARRRVLFGAVRRALLLRSFRQVASAGSLLPDVEAVTPGLSFSARASACTQACGSETGGSGTAETAVICREGMCRNAGGQSCDDYVFYVPTTTGPCMYAVRFGRTLSKRSLDRSIRSRGNRNRHRYYGVYN